MSLFVSGYPKKRERESLVHGLMAQWYHITMAPSHAFVIIAPMDHWIYLFLRLPIPHSPQFLPSSTPHSSFFLSTIGMAMTLLRQVGYTRIILELSISFGSES